MTGAAWAKIVSAQLLAEFLNPVNDADSAFHLRFGRETFASLASDFEVGFFAIICVVCHTVSVVEGCG